jgi:hypothetical protein
MLVRLLVARSGLRGAQNIGDEVEVANAEAIRMINSGQAVPVREAPEPEMATSAKRRYTRKPR